MRVPVENLETKLVAYHTVVGADVHGWCVFDGRLDVDLLKKAIAALCEEFPVLASRVVPAWINPYYETLPDPPPVSVLSIPWDDIYGIPEQALPFFEDKLDVFRGPLVKFSIPLLAGILARIGKDAIARVMPVSTCFSNVGRIPTQIITFGKVTPLFFSGSLPFMPGLGVVATAAGMRDLISLTLAHSKHGFDKERFLGYVKEFFFTRVAFSRRH